MTPTPSADRFTERVQDMIEDARRHAVPGAFYDSILNMAPAIQEVAETARKAAPEEAAAINRAERKAAQIVAALLMDTQAQTDAATTWRMMDHIRGRRDHLNETAATLAEALDIPQAGAAHMAREAVKEIKEARAALDSIEAVALWPEDRKGPEHSFESRAASITAAHRAALETIEGLRERNEQRSREADRLSDAARQATACAQADRQARADAEKRADIYRRAVDYVAAIRETETPEALKIAVQVAREAQSLANA